MLGVFCYRNGRWSWVTGVLLNFLPLWQNTRGNQVIKTKHLFFTQSAGGCDPWWPGPLALGVWQRSNPHRTCGRGSLLSSWTEVKRREREEETREPPTASGIHPATQWPKDSPCPKASTLNHFSTHSPGAKLLTHRPHSRWQPGQRASLALPA